jgi:hypothetical protein
VSKTLLTPDQSTTLLGQMPVAAWNLNTERMKKKWHLLGGRHDEQGWLTSLGDLAV